MLDLALPIAVGNRCAIVLEHVVEIETKPVASGSNARVDDVEPELVEHGGRTREPVASWTRENQYRGGPAHTARVEGHQRLIRARIALREEPRMPSHFLRRVLQKVDGGEAPPGPLDVGFRYALLHQQPP